MKYARVQVRASLNKYQLAALFKDAVCEKEDAAFPSMVRVWSATNSSLPVKNYPQVKVLVAQQLQGAGEESVSCGPQNRWVNDAEELWFLRHVVAVYKLEDE